MINQLRLPGLIASNYCSDYTTKIVYCSVYGITSGTYVGLMSAVLIDLIGLESFVQAFGIQLFCTGSGRIIGPPIIGKFKTECIAQVSAHNNIYIFPYFIQVHFLTQLETIMLVFPLLALSS